MTPATVQLALVFDEPVTIGSARKTRQCAPRPLRAVPHAEPLTLRSATAQARDALAAAVLLGSVSRVLSWWHPERRGWISTVALIRTGADPLVVSAALAGLGEVKCGKAFVAVYRKGES